MSKFSAMLGEQAKVERRGHDHNTDFVHMEYIGANDKNVSGVSDKFWMAWREGSEMVVKFGKRGTAGQIRRKKLSSASAALVLISSKIKEKEREGYRKVRT